MSSNDLTLTSALQQIAGDTSGMTATEAANVIAAAILNSGTSGTNTYLGVLAGNDITTGISNTAVGYNAGEKNATGRYTTACGANALELGNSYDRTGVGYYAGRNATGAGGTFVGSGADGNGTAINQTALGFGATVTGAGGVAIGVDSAGTGATAAADEIVLGTALHTVDVPGGVTVGGNLSLPDDTSALIKGNGIVRLGGSLGAGIRLGSSVTYTRAYGGTFELGPSGSAGPIWTSGTGSPEGVVTAVVGSSYARTDGGAGTSFYVKESGTGNTGWVGK